MERNAIDAIARSLAGGRSRRSMLKVLAASFAVAASGRIGLGQASAAGSGKIVEQYYDAIQKHEWTKAYGYLGSSLQAAQSLNDFIAGFHDTAYTSVFINHVGSGNSSGYAIDVSVFAWLNDGTGQHFDGTYYAATENGVLKIVDASLHAASTAGLPPLCQASQLTTNVQGDSATGHRYAEITVTNTGATCTLAGMPGVLIKDKLGAKVIRGKREAGSSIPSIALHDGESAVLQLDWTNWCGASIPTPIKASISLAGDSGHFTLSNPIGIPPCIGGQGSDSHLNVRPWQSA